jgi:RNA polymerase sigma-70 factor, ECF subfamily
VTSHTTSQAQTGALLDHLFRHQSGRLVAYLSGRLGPAHLDLAEEAVQTALLRAMQSWPVQGLPENPEAWLFRVAQNAALDLVRRERWQVGDADSFLRNMAAPPVACGPPDYLADDELRLIFLCCHPELPAESRIALSLKVACGFSVAEIARAFLADEATIAQRIVRAKRLIRDRHLTLDLPDGPALAGRLESALEVIYFFYNEGYSAHGGENLVRADLCAEALRLVRLLAASPVNAARVDALAALIALQSARLGARHNSEGDLILLDAQDRAQWDQRLIAVGFDHFERCMKGNEISAFHTQAAIAATHARASAGHTTDWPMILALYDQLFELDPSPVVALNRAVAIAKVRGAAEALVEVDKLEHGPAMEHYHLRLAVRGHLLLELGEHPQARSSFAAALECPCSEPERRFLRRQLARCITVADLEILFEDEQLIVLVKPSGMLVHPSVRERTGTLKELLMQTRGEAFFPHRLDRDTSGLMVIAKDALTARQLGFQFARREVKKVYTAVVAGIVEADSFLIDAPLGREAAEKPQWNVRPNGKPAQSRLHVIERRASSTVLELEPITGRTNQLRIHCAHIGHPIIGDVWYHGPSAPRLMLHASQLSFTHPISAARLAFTSELTWPVILPT